MQTLLFVFTGIAILLVSSKKPWKRWGYLVGLMGQPFWIYAAIQSEQWGTFAASLLCCYAWGRGIWNYIVREYWEWR